MSIIDKNLFIKRYFKMNREVKTNTVRLNRIYNGDRLVDIVRSNVSSNPDVDGRLETLEEEIGELKTTSGKCLGLKLTTKPWEYVSDEALEYSEYDDMSRDKVMSMTVVDWINQLAKVAYAPYCEMTITKNKLTSLESRSLQNPSAFEIRQTQRVDGYMEFYESKTYPINNVDDLAYAVDQSETALTSIISSNMMKIEVLQNRITDLETTVNELLTRIEAIESK